MEAEMKKVPKIKEGERLDAKISYDQALKLLNDNNEEERYRRHGLTVSKYMNYYAGKFDPDNVDFWTIAGLLHDMSWEKWPDDKIHSIKTSQILDQLGADPRLGRAIQTHSYEYNRDLPAPYHKMEKVLWAVDELSTLIDETVKSYPSKSVEDLNLKSLKEKYEDQDFVPNCERDYIAKGADWNDMSLEDLFSSAIAAAKQIYG